MKTEKTLSGFVFLLFPIRSISTKYFRVIVQQSMNFIRWCQVQSAITVYNFLTSNIQVLLQLLCHSMAYNIGVWMTKYQWCSHRCIDVTQHHGSTNLKSLVLTLMPLKYHIRIVVTISHSDWCTAHVIYLTQLRLI